MKSLSVREGGGEGGVLYKNIIFFFVNGIQVFKYIPIISPAYVISDCEHRTIRKVATSNILSKHCILDSSQSTSNVIRLAFDTASNGFSLIRRDTGEAGRVDRRIGESLIDKLVIGQSREVSFHLWSRFPGNTR